MKLKLKPVLIIALVVASIAITANQQRVSALSGNDFHAGRIIDDSVFFDPSGVSLNDIQAFLNAKVPVCDTNGTQPYNGTTRSAYGTSRGYPPPYICLKDYRQDVPSRSSEPGLCNGISAGNKSAAHIIFEVAQSCSINPRAILVLLQKEQSLITDDWPWSIQYRSATGYGCPDTTACDSQYYGFFNQVYMAARQFKRYALNPTSYNHRANRNNDVRYNPNASCGSSTVFIENHATAGLYNYTPYQPNQAALNNLYGTGDSCSAYGNRNFWRMYNDWFGGTWSNANGYVFLTSTATAIHFNPAGTGTISVQLRNAGLGPWYSDNNLPVGQQPTRLAMIGYENTPYADLSDPNWLGTKNQIRMSPDVVQPGETATFTFNVVAPYNIGSYNHRLVPIVGGAFLRDTGINVVLTTHTPAWNPLSSVLSTRDFLPNQQSQATFTVQNNSASSWYSDNNLPAGKQPTRLATIGYESSPFADTSDPNWLGTRNQIKMTPDVVNPGETATFTAYFIGPIRNTATSNNFRFVVSVGGVFTSDKGLAFNLTAPAANFSIEGVSSTNPPGTMSPGQIANVSYTIKNTGNVVWHDELYFSGSHALRLIMSHPLYRNGNFYNSGDPAWLSIGQVKKTNGTVWPGQNATFNFTWKAPSVGTYKEFFQLSVGGNFLQDYGTAFDTVVQ